MTQTTRFGLPGALLIVGLVTLLVGTGIVAAQVQVSGDFTGTMVGYGDDAETELGDRGNEIVVEGSMTIDGENAVEPTIKIESGEWTVLDTSSVEIFVEGEQSVEFEKEPGPDQVEMSPVAESIPEGTTLQIAFSTYFQGGTTDDELVAGTVSIDYETPGGTPDDKSFEVSVDASNSADNEINNLEQSEDRSETLSQVQKILSYVGILAIIIVVLWMAWKVFKPENGV